MSRLSIARSLRLALVGLTVALAVLAALGISSLYNARQRYERTLASSSALAVAAANLESAAIARQAVRREIRGPASAQARLGAGAAYASAAARARALARGDPTSRRLVDAEIAARRGRRVRDPRRPDPGPSARPRVGRPQPRRQRLAPRARAGRDRRAAGAGRRAGAGVGADSRYAATARRAGRGDAAARRGRSRGASSAVRPARAASPRRDLQRDGLGTRGLHGTGSTPSAGGYR